MKQKIYSSLALLIVLFTVKNTTAQTCGWTTIGPGAASTATTTSYNDIAMSVNDVPYISYCDPSANNSVAVKTFSLGSWQAVGNLASFTNSGHTSIAMTGTVPIVAFSDGTTAGRLTVKTFSSGAWTNIGAAVSTGSVSHVSLTMNGGVPN